MAPEGVISSGCMKHPSLPPIAYQLLNQTCSPNRKKTQLKSHKIRIVAAKSRYCVIADTPAEAYESFMPDGQKVKDLAREQDLRYQILPFNLSVPPLLNA